jgi:hypothetical protein
MKGAVHGIVLFSPSATRRFLIPIFFSQNILRLRAFARAAFVSAFLFPLFYRRS